MASYYNQFWIITHKINRNFVYFSQISVSGVKNGDEQNNNRPSTPSQAIHTSSPWFWPSMFALIRSMDGGFCLVFWMGVSIRAERAFIIWKVFKCAKVRCFRGANRSKKIRTTLKIGTKSKKKSKKVTYKKG